MKRIFSRKSLWLSGLSLAGILAMGVSTQCSPSASARAMQPGPPATYHANTTAPRSGQVPSNIMGPQRSYRKINNGGNVIAITFDDGPHPSFTPRLLDILKQRGIHGTFYVVGDRLKQYAGVVRRIAADGHEFGNHTWTHPLAPSRWTRPALENEIRKTHDGIVAVAGTAPKSYRPPGGSVTPAQMDWLLADFGYPTILWAVDPNDWKDRNSSLVTSRILNQTSGGDIVLTHDLYRTTVDAMPATLDGLLAKGFRFVTISQLIAIGQGKMAAADGAAGSTTEPVKMLSFSFSPGSF